VDDPLYGLTATAGLHILKDKWGQKAYLEAQCTELAANLAAALAGTVPPERNLPYFAGVRDDREVQLRESQWERALWEWSRKRDGPSLAGCWHSIVTYQVPLFAKQQKDKWGYIDLLGIDTNGTLAVLELKKEPGRDAKDRTKNSESPLRIVLEAAAYAVALRHNWRTFQPQLVHYLQTINFQPEIISKMPSQLSTVRLVGIAPVEYWVDWLPITPKGKEVTPSAWEAFRGLLDAFQRENLPTSFVSVDGDPMRPMDLKGRLLKGYPAWIGGFVRQLFGLADSQTSTGWPSSNCWTLSKWSRNACGSNVCTGITLPGATAFTKAMRSAM
jgi:hypothetical protein